MKKIIGIILIVTFFLGCEEASTGGFSYNKSYQYSDGTYKNLGVMISDCEGITIVVAVGINEGNVRSARHIVTVVDSKGKGYSCAGADFNISVGDTLKFINQ